MGSNLTGGKLSLPERSGGRKIMEKTERRKAGKGEASRRYDMNLGGANPILGTEALCRAEKKD